MEVGRPRKSDSQRRTFQALRLHLGDFSDKEISEKMGISERSVRVYINMEKNREQYLEKRRKYFKKWRHQHPHRWSRISKSSRKSNGKKRYRNYRLNFIERMGGACQICGYNKNVAALCIHHINPEDKENRWDWMKPNLENVMLLCMNCHAEVHNPSLSLRS